MVHQQKIVLIGLKKISELNKVITLMNEYIVEDMESRCYNLATEFEFDYYDPDGFYVHKDHLKEYSKEERQRIKKFLKLPKSEQAMQYLYVHLVDDFATEFRNGELRDEILKHFGVEQ